jgi:ABC-type Fe3+/spermidine/putrescine transport system ATPase subunit
MDSGRLAQLGTPQEIYRSPGTPFVADFVGTCSFLRGRVSRVDGEGLAVAIEGVGEIAIPRQKQAFAAGAAVSLALRPEWITVVADPGAGDLRAEVDAVEFVGAKFVHGAEVGGQAIRFEAPEPLSGTVWLRVDGGRVVAFAG